MMEWGKARKFLRSVCSRGDDAVALSRRDMLAGLGLAGLLMAAPKLLLSSAAEARTLNAPAVGSADATNDQVSEQSAAEGSVADSPDVTELSAQRRRYWRRRYWRRRYWRPRYYRRRYYRRRYWRRRYYW
jgi:hypothetical protein